MTWTRLRERALRDLPTPVRISFLAMAACWVAYVVLVPALGPGWYVVRDTLLYGVVGLGATALVFARAWLSAGSDRRVWSIMGLGLVLSMIGQIVYASMVAPLDPEPFPSVADPVFLAAYVAWYVAIALLVRERLRDLPSSVWLDGVVAVLAVGALLWAWLAAADLGDSSDALSALASTAYPLADGVLQVLAIAGIVLLGSSAPASLSWFAGAMAVAGAADLVLWNLTANGSSPVGTLVMALWPLSRLMIAIAAWSPSRTTARRRPAMSVLLFAPAASLVIATGVLVAATQRPIATGPIVLATLALLGVLVRLGRTVTETGHMIDAQRVAATDELTGLSNRRGFTSRARQSLAGLGSGDPAAVLMFDLDGFKEVNDSLGHHAGDVLLEHLADRLRTGLRGSADVLGRLGGDEFALLLPRAGRATADSAAERIAASLATPFVIDEVQVHVSASIGISIAPEHGDDLSLLLRRADIAMYRAKTRRLGSATFDPDLDTDGEDRLQRSAELRRAVEQGELVLHFQPKIALAADQVVAVEALVRWDRPGVGLVFPDHFLPQMEEAGLMPALTSVVLDAAVEQSARWARTGLHLPVAVNLPSAAVVDEALPQRVLDLLTRHGVPAELLQIEITEESLLRDRTRAQNVLARLRQIGIKISIDDYGSGYSSLAYLRELTVDEIKLDRAFVQPMADDDRAASIVRSTIDLAHALGLGIVAEGVEHEVAARELSAYGCDTAQGYFWSRPLPASDLVDWLTARALPHQRVADDAGPPARRPATRAT